MATVSGGKTSGARDGGGRTCPSCDAFVPAGRRACLACRLDVSKMDAFAAAKLAAGKRGLKGVKTGNSSGPGWWRPGLYFMLLLLGGLAYGGYWMFRPGPAKWASLPGSGQAAAQQLLTHISTGQDKEYDAAYGLIPDSARDPNANDEVGLYRQLFHNMNLYLSGEFGSDWIKQTQFEPDPADPDDIIAHVDIETLHIRVANQTPAAKSAMGPHYGVLGIAEFDISQAQGDQQMAAIEGIVGGAAGQGAINNLETIRGASGSPRNEPPMTKKARLLPIIRNPREVTWKAIVNLWPLRKDPVVRRRLEQITQDDRYEAGLREKATEVLTDKTSEEDLIAAGVQY